MKGKKLLVVSLTALPLILTSCGGGEKHDPSKDAVTRDDYTSVYDEIGTKVTIDMVEEDANGLAFVTLSGKKYELGMDFLSMAMVYNMDYPENSTKYQSQDDVYNEWWKLYIQRWNYLMPEIPLYSNQYYDLYATKLEGFKTSPYWSSADAINKTGSTDGKVILGNGTALSGAFRSAAWGKSSPGASDLDIQNLTSGYATVMTDFNGSYQWNLYDEDTGLGVLADVPDAEVNEDGTLTYTIEIVPGLEFSDGSEVKAKNYIAGLLANATAVGVEAGGTGNSGQTLVGFKEFKKDAETGKEFKGIKLFNDNEYKFSITLTADYAGYYYAMGNAGFSPDPLKLYLGSATDAIKTKEDGSVYLDSSFFAKNSEGKYTVAAEIKANLADLDASHIPYSGPFMVTKWDKSAEEATLARNPKYPGDKFRGTAYEDDGTYKSIDEIKYIKVESETQNTKFEQGEVNILDGITGGDDTKAALKLVSEGKAKETHYDRAGYGKLGFRADFGPTGFKGVRRAIAYSINRPEFAQQFTGGYGSVVNGPYYEGFSAFQAVKDTIILNKYTTSVASAKAELEAEGWVFDKDGKEYKSGIRYKKLSGYEKTLDNLTFKSIDGKYQTTYVNGEYYMPLAINWYGTQPNPVTDLLVTNWQSLKTANEDIGMYITYTSTDFVTGLYAEYMHSVEDGYDGNQKLNAINFASGFNSAMYDYSFNWTINQDYYEMYSACYLMDEADFWSNYGNVPNNA